MELELSISWHQTVLRAWVWSLIVRCRSTTMLTTFASRHTSTSKLYATYGRCYQMLLLRLSPAPWLLGGSVTVMQYCTVPRLRTLISYSVCRIRWPELTIKRRHDHITPVLADLHWLPVRHRIEYKIALITFNVLTTQQPQYLSELIRHYEAPKKLRSRGINILQTSTTVLNFSKSAFCHASPTV